MDKLPVELLSKIIDHLGPADLPKLQLVSKNLFTLSRDNTIWRAFCYEADCEKRALNNIEPRAGTAADWDPSCEREEVDWYSEYVARNAKVSISWLQDPGFESNGDGKITHDRREAKGIGLLKGRGYAGADKIVGPLDDGSVCVWDLSRSESNDRRKLRGKVVGKGKPGILITDSSRRESGINTTKKDANNIDFIGVSESVSIDSTSQRGYFGVGGLLNEVDMNTLQLISQQRYPFSIFAVSQEIPDYAAPLTVATMSSLHIYDSRSSSSGLAGRDDSSSLDSNGPFLSTVTRNRLYSPLPFDGTDYAPLFQPNPLAILHPPLPNLNSILLAGRFPSVLLYDRRFIQRIQGVAYSGASLCGLTAIPELPRRYSSTGNEGDKFQSLIACGEYKGRGSLEMYALSATEPPQGAETATRSHLERKSVVQNRQSASYSKLLSVAAHGTRIVFSDADGNIRWMERDAKSVVRTWNLNSGPRPFAMRHPAPINRRNGGHNRPGSRRSNLNNGAAVARKIIPTGEELSDDELLIWTGDRIGRLRFSSESEESDDNYFIPSVEDSELSRREAEYIEAMRRSLRGHAEQLNWMRNFGCI